MTTQTHTSVITLSNIDSELILDTEHVLMNYLKLNGFKENCFSNTNILLSQELQNKVKFIIQDSKDINTYTSFASNYFTVFISKDNAIDIISPLINSFPNSDLCHFLAILLGKHIIECAQKLDNEKEIFEKYKNYLFNIYHSIINQSNQKQKILESICSSITVLIVLGINGNWRNGLEQLIEAIKTNNTNIENNFSNILMTSLIISNINDVFEKLKEKISIQKSDTIRAYIKGNSKIIKEFVSFLIKFAFNGPKENFVNSLLFKAFIGIIQSLKYFEINIIKIHGFLEFLINCVSFLDINQELINQICDIFEHTFSDKINTFGLYFEAINEFKMEYFIEFLNNVTNHYDFNEIKNCIVLLSNVKNYYISKKIDIYSNPKDLQILFTSCNIFSNLCENFSYVFFINDIDIIVQDIFYYFINLKVLNISQILLNSLQQMMQYVHYGYDFNNFKEKEKIEKKNNFALFLYKIHNSVFDNMKLSNEEYNKVMKFKDFKDKNGKSVIRWDYYIKEILKENIDDDEKINYINNATEFYEDLYGIINNLYGIKDFFDKICQYLITSMQINSLDLVAIDTIFTVLNKISILLINDIPSGIYDIIDFILKPENIKFLDEKRFSLQFILLLFNIMTFLCKKKKYVYLLCDKLLNQKYDEEKMNIVVINFIYKLIITSYQTHKNNPNDKGINTLLEEDKNNMINLFNILSEKLLGNMSAMSDNYLLKLIDSLFASCFFNIYLGLFNNDVIFNIAEKFFKDANEIYNLTKMNNTNINIKELYVKYIYILFSIIKNIGNENSIILSDLLNKIDPYINNNITYFINIENNISDIISYCSDDNNIITSIILLYNTILKYLKEKTYLFNDIFQNIINKIHTSNSN